MSVMTDTDPTAHDSSPPRQPGTTRAGLPPRRAALPAPRVSTDRTIGRPVADTGLSKTQTRLVAKLAGDRDRIADLESMLERARKERDKHVRQAIRGEIAKALIGRTLGVSATTVSKLYGAGVDDD